MKLDRIFVLNMKKWRKIRGFSQKTLAERCEAAHTYIRQIENGSRTPSFAFIGKIAEALDINAYQLFYDEMAASGEGSERTEYIVSIKMDFLAKMARELDTVIDKIK
jgi:transcriptional regulator with XRE-family HTH domain